MVSPWSPKKVVSRQILLAQAVVLYVPASQLKCRSLTLPFFRLHIYMCTTLGGTIATTTSREPP